MSREFDLRKAINGISDVVVNRPPPLREFDQIYMKVGDMVIQAHYIAERFQDKDVVFIGDGDAIALSVMHLAKQGIFERGPKNITVLDFDERILKSIHRFAENYGFDDRITTILYNVVEPLPAELFGRFDAFYTNPPWGASNNGESVMIFLERGIEASQKRAEGAIVIADDPSLSWTQEVLLSSQSHASRLGFMVAEMIPQMHHYHLDDEPNLRSCTCLFRRVNPSLGPRKSVALARARLENFYGRKNPLRVRYVIERADLNYGKAKNDTYELVEME